MHTAKCHHRWIDWLRFITAFMVVACHCRSGHWTTWSNMAADSKHLTGLFFFAVTRPALELVIVFFVLSGFLVGTPTIQRAAEGTFRPLTYIVDRVTRIYVPLIPCMLAGAVFSGLAGQQIYWSDFFGCIAGLQGVCFREFAANSPLWSLAYEIWFYVMAGCAGALCTWRGRRWMIPVAGLLAGFLVFAELEVAFLFCWLFGAVGGIAPTPGKSILRIAMGAVASLCGLVISQTTFIHVWVEGLFSLSDYDVTRLSCLIIAFGLAISVPALAVMPAGRFISLERWGTRLATFSYTLYLIHYPLLHFWASLYTKKHVNFSVESVCVFAVKLISCLVVGWALYWAFEARTERVRELVRSMVNRLAGWPSGAPR
jgi:peptidoglycan/LPS O-acetylase OafA/YrhL